ncbi:hypothetical protein MNBD_ALPHA07-627 [hydrothermal vent metagenome]|uniref:Hedgehog/Intein (Hint) domain-containing protein n=1 Tax=hydrothermal vent metagenome TaxID=652676 RepID=A0A3B0RPQ5_9ZZZZ
MVLRTFVAFDNANFIDQTTGNGIINNSDTPDGTQFIYSAGGGTNVTLDDTSGGDTVFNDDQTGGHQITDGGGLVANGQVVESESHIFVRALDAFGNQTGPTIDITVFSQGGVTQNVWGFASDIPLQDGVTYVKTGGSNVGDSNYADFITCFGPDTQIETAEGPKNVTHIKPGDQVWTLNNGLQPVQWVGRTTVPGTGAFAPVVFAPGAIGNGAELVVSQQHRILLENDAAELLFGEKQVLVAAKHLCGMKGVALRPQANIDYTHLMFDQHQIIRSNGSLTESFFLTENSANAIEVGQKSELEALFPTLKDGIDNFGSTEALVLKANEASTLRAYLS